MNQYKDYQWKNSKFTNAHSIFMKPIIKMLPKDGSAILDVGCGNGSFANYLIKNGYNVYGTDASVTGIQIANEQNPGRFYLQDVTKDDIPSEMEHIKFKTIISTEVIEHLYSPRLYIQFCKSILNKAGGGNIIISTPYHGYLKNLVLSLINAWDTHFTVLWDGGHIKFWSVNTLTELLNEFSFKIVDFKGCGRAPFLWKSMLINAKL